MTRRERIRQITIEEIKSLARRQMAETGTAGISLNAIARSMDISGPALYRYFTSRDDLITTLVVDAYTELANNLERTAQENAAQAPANRLMLVLLAYRRWALDHPVDFQLIFGNPIPGYQGPAEITSPVAQKVFEPILRILAEAYFAGLLKPLSAANSLPDDLKIGIPDPGSQLPIDVVYVGVVGWYHIHGMILLELCNHIQPLVSDPGLFYQHELLRLFATFGLKLTE